MKNAILCIFAMFACLSIFAQERIAVFPFEDLDNVLTQNESILFYREFSNEFTNKSLGKFNVVPRQDVEKLINTEAVFQLSDFSSRAKTTEMERVLNRAQILSGVIGKVGSRLTISVSLYTYPELVQQPGGTSVRVANIDELFDKIPELVQSMQNEITASKPLAVSKPPTETKPTYYIGGRGPGGGTIFFAEGGQYMEISGELGRANWDEAKRTARNYRGGDFSDWHLPTMRELGLARGRFTSFAWSSDEKNRLNAYGIAPADFFPKKNLGRIYAIRSF